MVLKKNNIIQQGIANDLGISQAAVNALLNGKPFGKKKTARAWSKLYGFTINWLLTGEEPMFQKNVKPSVYNTGDNNNIVAGRGMQILADENDANADEIIEYLKKQLHDKDEIIFSLKQLLQAKGYFYLCSEKYLTINNKSLSLY